MGLLGVCRGIGLESGFGFRIWGRSPATSFGQTGKLDWYIFVHCILEERESESLHLWQLFRRSHGREGRDGSDAGRCIAGSGEPPPPRDRRFLAEI